MRKWVGGERGRGSSMQSAAQVCRVQPRGRVLRSLKRSGPQSSRFTRITTETQLRTLRTALIDFVYLMTVL